MIVDYFEQIKEFIDSFKKDALSGEHILLENLKDHLARCVELLDLLEKDGSMIIECNSNLMPKELLKMYTRIESSVVSKVKARKPVTEEEQLYTNFALSLVSLVTREMAKGMLLEVLLGEPESIPKKASCH